MSVRARVSSGDPVTSDISRSPQAPCPPTNSQVTALHHDLAAPLPTPPCSRSPSRPCRSCRGCWPLSAVAGAPEAGAGLLRAGGAGAAPSTDTGGSAFQVVPRTEEAAILEDGLGPDHV